ncbi:unnamed protein product [Pipistrellus nathusii]|uniref:Uncharacterized protein n=1 Tax=Pipistrellus nathusii TaxID=59473 RepID=A0ABP0AHJ4_PIPNA
MLYLPRLTYIHIYTLKASIATKSQVDSWHGVAPVPKKRILGCRVGWGGVSWALEEVGGARLWERSQVTYRPNADSPFSPCPFPTPYSQEESKEPIACEPTALQFLQRSEDE